MFRKIDPMQFSFVELPNGDFETNEDNHGRRAYSYIEEFEDGHRGMYVRFGYAKEPDKNDGRAYSYITDTSDLEHVRGVLTVLAINDYETNRPGGRWRQQESVV